MQILVLVFALGAVVQGGAPISGTVVNASGAAKKT
jgi:hypothetical protein